MTIAYFCVLISGFMPILWAGYAKVRLGFKLKNNLNPREFLASATGKAQRSNWAQQNSWEAFAPFAAAVIIAAQVGVQQSTMDTCALIFIGARLVYGICYICDQSLLRSAVWSVGVAATVALYYFTWAVSA